MKSWLKGFVAENDFTGSTGDKFPLKSVEILKFIRAGNNLIDLSIIGE